MMPARALPVSTVAGATDAERFRAIPGIGEGGSRGDSGDGGCEELGAGPRSRTLVLRAQEGDREAFGRLVEQFQPTVYAIALRRLGNASEALELTQEVFLHVLRRIDQLREPERFAGWLRQVAVRMAINRATRRVAPAERRGGRPRGGLRSRADEPLDELISRERAERLWEALGRLKALDRETLVAFYIRGLSLLEMAGELDVPAGDHQAAAAHGPQAAAGRARGLGRRRRRVDRRGKLRPGRRRERMGPSVSERACRRPAGSTRAD